MAQAKKGDKVKVHYTGRLTDGTEFDSSAGREPLEFTIGRGQVIPGFENGVIDLNPGESIKINIPVDQAYGSHREEMVVEVSRGDIPGDVEPEVGQQLQARSEDGREIVMLVTAVNEATIILDANHPLAGKELEFDIELVEIV